MDNQPKRSLVDRQVDGMERIEKQVNKVLIPLWQKAPYYLTVAFALGLVGLFQFASIGFDPTRLWTVEFWIPVAIIGAAIFIIFTSTAKEYESRYASEDKDIQGVRNSIQERAKGQSFLKLPEFLAHKNIDLRIQRWKEILSDRERKLDSKASENDLYIYSKGSVVEKKDNKYTIEKEKLKVLRSDEYIKTNIAYIKLPKLLQYNMSMIIGDVTIGERSAFIQSDNELVLREGTLKVLTRVALSAALGTLVITTTVVDLGTITRLVGNLFLLVVTFFDAVLLARVLVNGIIKGRHIERMQVLDEYYNWLKTYKEPTPIEIKVPE
jgi:ABC-type multidrug transport system fused ATPase/permease subunit